jgi:hypothetical protein
MTVAAKRYLVAILALWLSFEAIIIGFNLVIDPLGISPIKIHMRLNALKPFRNGNDALVKRYEVDRRQPRTVFTGSSRTKQTIDPSPLNGTVYGPAYNAGVDGQADIADTESLLDHYFREDRNLRYAYIEIFPTAVLSLPGVHPLEEDSFTKRFKDWSTLLNSYGGLSYSWRTVAYNLDIGPPLTGDIKEVRDDGFSPVTNLPNHFSVYNVPNFLVYTDTVTSGKRLSSEVAPALTHLISRCKAYEVSCSFIISPLHADALYGIYFKNVWRELETLKRTLADLAPTWDFTRYNSLIDERDGPVTYWPEAFHYSRALGSLMLRRIFTPDAADLPPNFGVLIDPRCVDDQLAAWRAERNAWIAEHPEVIARYNAAAESERKGLSFAEATDAFFKSYTP